MNNLLKTFSLTAVCTIALASCNNNHSPAPAATPQPAATNATPKPDSMAGPKPARVNIPDGPNETRYDNGVLKAKGNYLNGQRTGEWQSFYPSGKLWSDESYSNGLAEGKATVYYENGQKMYEGMNAKGQPTGVWHYWNQKGEIVRTTDYSKKGANNPM